VVWGYTTEAEEMWMRCSTAAASAAATHVARASTLTAWNARPSQTIGPRQMVNDIDPVKAPAKVAAW